MDLRSKKSQMEQELQDLEQILKVTAQTKQATTTSA